MIKRILSLVIGLVFCFSVAIASASLTVPLSGIYDSGPDGGITGFGDWSGVGIDTMVSLEWLATENISDGTWTYQYIWTAAHKDLSHLNIQVSENFSDSDVINWSVAPANGETYEIGTNFDGNTWNAFKFDDLGDALSYTLTLTTNRMPMDGNFYAKDGDGGAIYAYNTKPIAVPNSAVPIPSTILLLGAGLAGLVSFRKKKIAK